MRERNIIYPGILTYMDDHGLSFKKFSDLTGIPITTLAYSMSGDRGTSKFVIDAILKATGMTYEEAFGEERGNG